MSDTKARWKNYKLESTYIGDKSSPFDPNNKHINIIKITNEKNGNFAHYEVWGTTDDPVISTEKQLIFKFFSLLQTALLGSLDPLNFCKAMGLPPENQLISEPKFLACRATTKAIFAMLTENIHDIMREMIGQGLAMPGPKISLNGKAP